MENFLQLEITDYFFKDNRKLDETIEAMMNIYFKYKDEKLNIYEVEIISNDIFEVDRKTFLLINILFKVNDSIVFNKTKKIQILSRDTNTINLYYLVYSNISIELMKIINDEVTAKMNKYFSDLLGMMSKKSIGKNINDYNKGIIINDNKKFSYLFLNENSIDSIILKNTIFKREEKLDLKDVVYHLDLKNKFFIRELGDDMKIVYLKENKLIESLKNKIKEKNEINRSEDLTNKMQLFLNELFYFYEEDSNDLESYLLLLKNILYRT